MAERQGYPRGRRLRKRREYLAVRAEGRRWSSRDFLLLVRLGPATGEGITSPVAARPRFGITVTRKVGDAVTRNRIKRVVREACRRIGDLFPPGAEVVVVARPSAVALGAAETLADLTELAYRIPGARAVPGVTPTPGTRSGGRPTAKSAGRSAGRSARRS